VKKGNFPSFFVSDLSDNNRESHNLMYLVEQLVLYKTLYMATLSNSIFPNIFLVHEYTVVFRDHERIKW